MRENLIHRATKVPILEWIRTIPYNLEDDHVDLASILSGADGFELEGEEKLEFIRRCLRSLIDAGAVTAVINPPGSAFLYSYTDRFGTERDEIIENVIADWQAKGGGDLEWGDYPFTSKAYVGM